MYGYGRDFNRFPGPGGYGGRPYNGYGGGGGGGYRNVYGEFNSPSDFHRDFGSFPNPRRYRDLEYYDEVDEDDDDDESFGSDLVDMGDSDAPETDFWRLDRADPLTARNLRRVPQVAFDVVEDEWVDRQRVGASEWTRRRREDWGSWGRRWGRY